MRPVMRFLAPLPQPAAAAAASCKAARSIAMKMSIGLWAEYEIFLRRCVQARKQGALDLPPGERAKAKLVRRYSAVDSLRFSAAQPLPAAAAAASTSKAARKGKGRVQVTVPGEVKSTTESVFCADQISLRRIASNHTMPLHAA